MITQNVTEKKNKKPWKTVLVWTGIALVLILAIVAIGAWRMFGTFVTAARSIRKIEDGLYIMEYRGDYGFDDFLARGGAADDSAVADYLTGFLSRGYYKKADNEIKPGDFGCSTVCAKDENGIVYFGRNYDWGDGRVMIVHTVPDDGYESFSTCFLDFLGFGDDYTPDGSMQDRIQTLAAIYVPLDGMNEKGLVVADLMAGDMEETHQKTDKPDLTTTTAIRLLLDRAADADEAIALLKQYDMNSSIGAAHHLSIADANGKSVVVEYVNGEMLVTETRIVTNHYLSACAKRGVGSEQSHKRFETLEAHTGPAGAPQVLSLLKSAAQSNYPRTDGSYEKTLWSIVYCPEKGSADFYSSEKFDRGWKLQLGKKDGFLEQSIP